MLIILLIDVLDRFDSSVLETVTDMPNWSVSASGSLNYYIEKGEIITVFFLKFFLVLYSKEECLKDGCNHEGQDNDSEQVEDDEVNSSPAIPSDNDVSLDIQPF